MVALLGPRDELLRTMERQFPHVEIHVRGNEFRMTGPSADVALIERLIDELLVVIEAGQPLNRDAVERSIGMLRAQHRRAPRRRADDEHRLQPGTHDPAQDAGPEALCRRHRRAHHRLRDRARPAPARPTSPWPRPSRRSRPSRSTGSSSPGPAVEAGERLGFLPGTLNDKIDPYLRPLYDALHDMIDPESIPRLMAAGTIEVAPLAYMRGRTLNDAFIILDEAQNTSPEQMKMFLTRLGFGSKMVVTGDVTQVDLPGRHERAAGRARDPPGIDDVHFAELTPTTSSGTASSAAIVDAYGTLGRPQRRRPHTRARPAGAERR
jgi:phosphate starvation-inducible PhoH-like protein